MATVTQERRLFTFTSPLGPDVFAVTGFTGREELSRPFAFHLDLVSENLTVQATDLVGQKVGWTVNFPDASPRNFHGYVSRLTAGPRLTRAVRAYRVEVVPWLWFLTRATDCRIFQSKTAPEIIKAVFTDAGFSSSTDLKQSLSGTYATRDYCAQYRETNFDFVSRLMEEEGIYYYFEFAEGQHTLVMADTADGYFDCDPHGEVVYRPDTADAEVVSDWNHQFTFRSGKVTYRDYNFETPSTNLETNSPTTLPIGDHSKYEIYDYPGRYGVTGTGSNLVKVRMEEVEVGFDNATGASRCSSFAAGGKFTLKDHPADAENAEYVFLAVEHTATEGQVAGTSGGAADYENTFVCMPSAVPFRPARVTHRPLVHGPQPAVVTGPSGEEIYVDKYGRIKVQFFWDRDGTNDEKSSCWIRVAEMWAGKNWGMISTPRIGQEVLVEFLEGDPDRPIVTGRVYNAEQMPPYDLPANMTQSGLKTRSTKQGGTADFNELRFEDKKDSEDIYFHAQKDFHRYVENNDDLQVLGNQTITVKLDRTEEVSQGNETITIKQGDRTEEVTAGNETVTIKAGKRTLTVEGDDTHTVKTGKRTVTVETADDIHTVKTGNRQVSVDTGNDELTVKTGNIQIKASAGAITIEAAQSITLKVGSNSIEIGTAGVTIKGTNVSIEAQAQMTAKGNAKAELSAAGQAVVKGGMVMIN